LGGGGGGERGGETHQRIAGQQKRKLFLGQGGRKNVYVRPQRGKGEVNWALQAGHRAAKSDLNMGGEKDKNSIICSRERRKLAADLMAGESREQGELLIPVRRTPLLYSEDAGRMAGGRNV